jgi:diguanylate cyclase (GGDEF)-like protein/PAS domain S-box-containing protein
MTLRSKTVILVAAALVTLLALLYISSRGVLLYSFTRLEDKGTERDLQRALNALQNRLEELDTTAYDWASWDDTYRFMADRDPEFVESNLLGDTLVALRLNALLLVNPSGEIVFGKALDLQDQEEIPLPQSLLGHLTSDGLLPPGGEPGSHATGILLLPEGPILVASRPILTSTDEGPSRGWLIMAQYLDSTEVERLGQIIDTTLIVQPLDQPNAAEQLQAVRSELLEDPSSIVVRPLSTETVAGYAALEDLYGAPVLLVGVEMPREIYRGGQTAITYLLTSILLVGLGFGTLQYAVLDRQVLARVIELGSGVASIRSRDDLSARLTVAGQDELSNLTSEINNMLERIQATQTHLEESEERFRSMADGIREGLTIIEDGRVVYVNDSASDIFGYSKAELKQMQDLDLAASEDKAQLKRIRQEARRSGKMPEELEFWITRKDGDRRYVSNRYTSSSPDDGARHTYVVTTDITDRKAAEDELLREKHRLEILLEEFPLGVAIVSKDGRYEYLNPQFVQMFGYTLEDIPTGREWFRRAHPDEAYRAKVISTWLEDLKAAAPGEARPRTFTVRCKDQSDKIIHFRPVGMEDGDQFLVCEDITERQRAEERIKQLAYHDPLTGLPNRTLFYDRMDVALAHAKRSGDKLAVLLMDLDQFKEINDSLGHITGDKLLQAIGERLKTLLRESDTICRMGGDEFLILLTRITSVDEAYGIAGRVLEAIRKPFVLNDQQVHVTTSLGVAIYPDDAKDGDTLIKRTDVAMYFAKERGRDNFQRYSSSDHKKHPRAHRGRSAGREPAR